MAEATATALSNRVAELEAQIDALNRRALRDLKKGTLANALKITAAIHAQVADNAWATADASEIGIAAGLNTKELGWLLRAVQDLPLPNGLVVRCLGDNGHENNWQVVKLAPAAAPT